MVEQITPLFGYIAVKFGNPAVTKTSLVYMPMLM